MIFVDTGAWYASLVPTDPDHTAAAQWLATNRVPLLTTDYVIDETLKRFETPDETRVFDKGQFEIVHIGGGEIMPANEAINLKSILMLVAVAIIVAVVITVIQTLILGKSNTAITGGVVGAMVIAFGLGTKRKKSN